MSESSWLDFHHPQPSARTPEACEMDSKDLRIDERKNTWLVDEVKAFLNLEETPYELEKMTLKRLQLRSIKEIRFVFRCGVYFPSKQFNFIFIIHTAGFRTLHDSP